MQKSGRSAGRAIRGAANAAKDRLSQLTGTLPALACEAATCRNCWQIKLSVKVFRFVCRKGWCRVELIDSLCRTIHGQLSLLPLPALRGYGDAPCGACTSSEECLPCTNRLTTDGELNVVQSHDTQPRRVDWGWIATRQQESWSPPCLSASRRCTTEESPPSCARCTNTHTRLL